ncbi:MAG: glutamate-cysteine ligase family protein [Coriobacteriales bacterium]
MDQQFDNKQIIVDYLQGGCKGRAMGTVGVELEQFLYDEDDELVPYEEKHGRLGVKDLLEQLVEFYPEAMRTEAGDIMGCVRPSAAVTIEPACQLEISIAPMASVAEVEREYRNFAFHVGQIIDPRGYHLLPYGYDPYMKAEDKPLIPKPRYHFMDDYFAKIPGMHAERMMRGSCSLQVSLDFADEADAVRKMRIATLLGPVFSLITDNVPVFQGEPNVTPLRRMKIWREVDPARCQVTPGLFDEDFGFEKYAEYLLATPPIFTTRPDEHATGSLTAAEVYGDAPMRTEDVEHLLGMFWNDVRLKRYVEVRQGDALPLEPGLGYVALIKGVFYSDTNLDILEHALGVGDDGVWPYTEQSVEDAIDAIVADGFNAEVYGRTATAWIDLLFSLAPDGLGTEVEYLEPLKDFKGL